jgi:glycosyltransferase involved in cell wall biosynthesis
MPRISVIIPTKHRVSEVINCVGSILAQTMVPDEILVVDGSRTDHLRLELERCFGRTKQIRHIHTEPGLTRQRNVGIRNSSGDIVIFFDDDLTVDRNYVQEISRIFSSDTDHKIGGVTGNVAVSYPELQRWYDRRVFRILQQLFATFFFLQRRGDGRFLPSGLCTIVNDPHKFAYVEYVSGCNMAFRREVFNEFLFDENLYSYMRGEDEDFSYRLSRKYQIVYTPYAKVQNDEVRFGKNRYENIRNRIKNHFYLFRKNMPKTFTYKLAFMLSIVGSFLMEVAIGIMVKSSEGVSGFLVGLREYHKI